MENFFSSKSGEIESLPKIVNIEIEMDTSKLVKLFQERRSAIHSLQFDRCEELNQKIDAEQN